MVSSLFSFPLPSHFPLIPIFSLFLPFPRPIFSHSASSFPFSFSPPPPSLSLLSSYVSTPHPSVSPSLLLIPLFPSLFLHLHLLFLSTFHISIPHPSISPSLLPPFPYPSPLCLSTSTLLFPIVSSSFFPLLCCLRFLSSSLFPITFTAFSASPHPLPAAVVGVGAAPHTLLPRDCWLASTLSDESK